MSYALDSNYNSQPENPGRSPSLPVEPVSAPIPPQETAVKLPKSVPLISYGLIGLTVFVFILQMASLYLLGEDYPAYLLIKSNTAIQMGQLWRLITPVLLHDDSSLLHIGFNMYALFVLGPSLERFYGHGRFLALYLVTGLAGNLFSFFFTAENSLGASTSIFGLIAAQLVFVYVNRKLFGPRSRSMIINIVVIIVINLGLGFIPGIDIFGHLGGLTGGIIFAWFAGPLLMIEQSGSEFAVKNSRSGLHFWGTFALETTFLLFLAMIVIYGRR